MSLQALNRYYDILAENGEVAKIGFSVAKVTLALNLDSEGEIISVMHLQTTVTNKVKGKEDSAIELPKEILVPEAVTRSSGIIPNFLCDTSKYLLGVESIDIKQKEFSEKEHKIRQREMDCFEAAKKLHEDILADINNPFALAIVKHFRKWSPVKVLGHPIIGPMFDTLKKKGNIVFRYDGKLATEVNEITAAWMRHYQQKTVVSNGPVCAITGDIGKPIARIHSKIKGIPGAQTAGASLVGFNAPAYESHSFSQGENAPISEEAMFKYTTVLNKLIADRKHSIQMGETTIVFWSESQNQEYADIFAFATNPKPDASEQLSDIMGRISRGQFINGELINWETPFYVLGISPNAARLSVRFFLRGNFGQFINNIEAHYERMKIVRSPGDYEFVSPFWLLQETTSKNARTRVASPLLTGSFFRAVLANQRYPEMLLQMIIMRVRAEQSVNRNKAATIKAFLIKNKNINGEVLTVALNETCTDKAYVLGRLFAVLERIQTEATTVNTTIKDKYFASACATPIISFPVLLKLTQHHLSKLKKSNTPKFADYREKEIGQLLDLISMSGRAFPSNLNLEDQGKFILGYYHQVQDKYKKRSDTGKTEGDENNG